MRRLLHGEWQHFAGLLAAFLIFRILHSQPSYMASQSSQGEWQTLPNWPLNTTPHSMIYKSLGKYIIIWMGCEQVAILSSTPHSTTSYSLWAHEWCVNKLLSLQLHSTDCSSVFASRQQIWLNCATAVSMLTLHWYSFTRPARCKLGMKILVHVQ